VTATGGVAGAPLRIGVLGAARIAELAIVKPARVTGHRLVAVAARDRRRAEDFARRHGVERALGSYADALADPDVDAIYHPLANALHGPVEPGRRSSYTCQLQAFAAHLREGAPAPTGAVANMQLIDDCYRAAGLSRRGEKEMVET
jgi:predicted dehydrogenase